MIEQRAFSLFEVLVSLVILSVLLVSISKLYIEKDTNSLYYELQKMENEFVTSQTITNTTNIKIQSY